MTGVGLAVELITISASGRWLGRASRPTANALNSLASSWARSMLRFATIMRRSPGAVRWLGANGDRLACSYQERGVILEPLEDGTRELHCCRCNRDRVRTDARLRAHAFGHLKSSLQQPMQVGPDGSLIMGCAISILQLPEDL